MSKTEIMRVTVKASEPLPKGASDWQRLDAMTDEKVIAAAIVSRDYCDHKIAEFTWHIVKIAARAGPLTLQPLDEFAADSLQIAQSWTFDAIVNCGLDLAPDAPSVPSLLCREPR
jgi:hypothetical protein